MVEFYSMWLPLSVHYTSLTVSVLYRLDCTFILCLNTLYTLILMMFHPDRWCVAIMHATRVYVGIIIGPLHVDVGAHLVLLKVKEVLDV